MSERIVIATRGSKLALWQAEHLKARMMAVMPGLEVALEVIKTSGDMILDRPLAEVGGKGLFVKEIEQALLDKRADLAVHSMKDVPAELARGLELFAVSSREVPWDALCVRDGVGATTLDALPKGARVGTSSLRRKCQLLAKRPDLEILMLRGNVPTRVGKLEAGEFDAIVLAAAGLTRLGMADHITQELPLEISIPAVGQGVLGIETRSRTYESDPFVLELVHRAIHDAAEARRVAAERAFLLEMGGSCQTPLAAHAVDAGGQIRIVAMCGMPDGSKILRAEAEGSPDDAEALGKGIARDLLGRGAAEILQATN